MNAVCGTPRLVRNGVASHEATQEGSTGRRFIAHNLARTAIGTDRSGNKIIIAAIEPTESSNQIMGASLKQTSEVMKLLGAYQAMNLDGGGSTGMVVQDDHVFFDGVDPLTRRIAVGLGVIKRSHVLRRTPVTGSSE
jgi:exopolysaccharide biosynthesis protein